MRIELPPGPRDSRASSGCGVTGWSRRSWAGSGRSSSGNYGFTREEEKSALARLTRIRSCKWQ